MANIKFQTVVEIPAFSKKTGYTKNNVFIGSCFTENVGNKMEALKFPVDINPFGILYNPASVAGALWNLLLNKQFQKEDLTEYNGLWHSFSHHGRFSSVSEKETLRKINERIAFSSAFLKNADFLFLTFGTAWVYRYKNSGNVVSNCHKIPANKFEHFRLTVDEITEEYKKLLVTFWKVNPNCQVIFTVSPVRHWKDGAIENQRSKATLLLAIDKILEEFANQNCCYFPAYEIVMDELRDYRFYNEDMLHISDVAINHIWSIFEEKLIEPESLKLIPGIQKLNKAFHHRPINKNSSEYLSFLRAALNQVKDLEKQFPNLNFELEKQHFNTELYEISKNFEQF